MMTVGAYGCAASGRRFAANCDGSSKEVTSCYGFIGESSNGGGGSGGGGGCTAFLRASENCRSAVDLASATNAPLIIGNNLQSYVSAGNESATRDSSTNSSVGNIFVDGLGNATRSSSLAATCASTSRPGIPHLAHYSDSGFSSFSSCTYLPPPPPYRQRSNGPVDSNANISGANAAPQSAENSPDAQLTAQKQFDFSRNTQRLTTMLRRKNSAKNMKSTLKNNNNNRIHRSLSDSKYRAFQDSSNYGEREQISRVFSAREKINNNNKMQKNDDDTSGLGNMMIGVRSVSDNLSPSKSNALNVSNAAAMITSSFSTVEQQQKREQLQRRRQQQQQRRQQQHQEQQEQELRNQQQKQQEQQELEATSGEQQQNYLKILPNISASGNGIAKSKAKNESNLMSQSVHTMAGYDNPNKTLYANNTNNNNSDQQQHLLLRSFSTRVQHSRQFEQQLAYEQPYHTRVSGSLGDAPTFATPINVADNSDNMSREEWCKMSASLLNLSLVEPQSSPCCVMSTSQADAEASITPHVRHKLQRWTMARDSLLLQVAVLEKHVSAQKERIRQFEGLLDAKRNDLPHVGGAPNAADVVDEIAQLKRKCAAFQREKVDAQRRLGVANVEIERLQNQPNNNNNNNNNNDNDDEENDDTTTTTSEAQQHQHLQQQQFQQQQFTRTNRNGEANTKNVDEMEKLRQTIQRLLSDNQQKNMEITSLRQALGEQARSARAPRTTAVPTDGYDYYESGNGRSSVPPVVSQNLDINAQLRRLLLDDELLAAEAGGSIAHSSSFPTSLCHGSNGNGVSQFQRTANALQCYADGLGNAPVSGHNSVRASPNTALVAASRYGANNGGAIQASTSYTHGLATHNNVGSAYGGRPLTASAAAFASAANALWASTSTATSMPTTDGTSPSRQSAALAHHHYALPHHLPTTNNLPYYNNGGAFMSPTVMSASHSSAFASASAISPNFTVANGQDAYRAGTSSPAAARQLAAELDELRRSGDFQQRFQPNGAASLPRAMHAKSNSASGLSLPRVRQQEQQINQQLPYHYLLPQSHCGGGGGSDGRASSSSDASSIAPSKNKINYNASVRGGGNAQSRRNKKCGLPRTNVASDDELATFALSASSSSAVEARRRARAHAVDNAGEKSKHGRTRSTLRNLFGRLARSSSQDLRHSAASGNGRLSDSLDRRHASVTEFTHGIRPSMSARFVDNHATALRSLNGDVSPPPLRPTVQQFVDWSCDEVCEWLCVADFAQYVSYAARFIRSGRHLLNMTNAEFEKELQIKSGIHRRRLKCLLNCIERNTGDLHEPADRMDIHQVMLWLDDIGLPQFRDAFAELHVDGQLLLCLTAADLVEMQITTAINHATFARAIQLLRAIDFRVHRLEKRFPIESLAEGRCGALAPAEVERWAAGCVADWLRSIDLAEFTPNLMFSGIHGALMMNEPTFTAESLAEVLEIPAHKTLLRRHLTTHFNNILGQEIIGQKRDVLAQPFVTHLSPQLRIKLVKKGFLTARKKSKNDIFVEPHTPVCPTTRLAKLGDDDAETENGAQNDFTPTNPTATTPTVAADDAEMTDI